MKPRKSLTFVEVLGAVPLVIRAAEDIGATVATVKAPASDGGAIVTDAERLEVAKAIHAGLWDTSVYLAAKALD